ncbi:MAG: GTP 3',8-cyclase MoaA [Thermoguttaceae bacterium]
MSVTPLLIDGFGRVHTDLRISVTDRCNLRCFYCMPAEGVAFVPHAAILTFEEIQRVVRVAVSLGVRRVRLTGGEPLVRKGICRLVEMLAAVPGIEDLAMTTNGILLAEYAEALKAAGLQRLNISLDTLDPGRFQQITRRQGLAQVLAGIEAACRAGFRPIKLNAVAMRGWTEPDVARLAQFALQRGLELRFIEFMPLCGDHRGRENLALSAAEVLELLAEGIGPLEPDNQPDPHCPATYYRFTDGGGRIGLIRSLSHPFCDRCSRLRLTADGKLRNCLFSAEEWDVRSALRGTARDGPLVAILRAAVVAKKPCRGSQSGGLVPAGRLMHQIGG